MQSKPPAASALTAELRQRLEAEHTFRRVVELELDPVRGSFDAAHLKEVNRRIFQDLPASGFTDVTPGEFRQPVAEGFDWMKQRGLTTIGGAFHVAYSRMDDAAIARMDKALEAAKPDQLRGLDTAKFTARLSEIYTELDDATHSAMATAVRCAASPSNWPRNRALRSTGRGSTEATWAEICCASRVT